MDTSSLDRSYHTYSKVLNLLPSPAMYPTQGSSRALVSSGPFSVSLAILARGPCPQFAVLLPSQSPLPLLQPLCFCLLQEEQGRGTSSALVQARQPPDTALQARPKPRSSSHTSEESLLRILKSSSLPQVAKRTLCWALGKLSELLQAQFLSSQV